MFSKRKKKKFAPGTFIPTAARVMAILQLCLAFTAIAWNAGIPFMGELFAVKSKGLLYQTVMGKEELASQIGRSQDDSYLAHLQRNGDRFALLPQMTQKQIIEQYDVLQKKVNTPFTTKLFRSLTILIAETPPFEQAWIAFSIAISIMILMRIEGALQAAWLLPLLVLCYGIDNRLQGKEHLTDRDARMFPREEAIVKDYLREPLSSNIFEQKKQLTHGWQLYLIQEWTHEMPSKDSTVLQKQAEDGEFLFNIARLQKLSQVDHDDKASAFEQKKSVILLTFYLVWNLFFAWFVNRSMRKESYTTE